MTHRRTRVALACALAAACALASGVGWGASATTVITTSVPSATFLSTTACPPTTTNVTDFGIVLPGAVTQTSADCAITFGSSNDSASLRVGQADGTGTAMGRGTDAWTRTSGTSSRFADVDEAAGTAFVVRTNGQLRRSMDDGLTWATTVGVDPLHDRIDVATASVAWLSGGGSTQVRRSSNANGGTPTFPVTAANPGINVQDIAATSATTAWVVGDGGLIRMTSDSGSSWNVVASPTTSNLTGIFALDADSLVAWGSGGVVVATSDGTTWRDISIAGGPSFNSMTATSDSNIIGVSGGGSIMHTSNAHLAAPTWNSRATTSVDDLWSVSFWTANDGVAFGEFGVRLVTANGGASWTRGRISSSIMFHKATLTSAGTWLGVGASQQILRATSLLGTWSPVAPAPVPSWHDVDATTDGTAWRVGSGGAIETTTDFGATWSAQASSTTAELLGVYAFDSQRAVAVGWNGTIVGTSNGGTTWTTRSSGTSVELAAIDGTGDGRAWVVGDEGTILGTTDFGATWTEHRTGAGQRFYAVAAFDSDTAVALGQGGLSYRTTNFSTWTAAPLPTGTDTVRNVRSVPGSATGFYSAYGAWYRTTDKGATWVMRSGPGTMTTNAFTAASETRLFAVGSGNARISSDAGATWQAMTGNSLTFHWLYAADAVDPSRAIAVGDGNAGGHTTTTADVPDYVQDSTDWYDHGPGAFGICLRSTTANATWTTNATCDQAADGPHWRAVPQGTAAGSEAASTASGDGNRVANFRFGLRVPASTPPGQLSAGITFVVIAPDV